MIKVMSSTKNAFKSGRNAVVFLLQTQPAPRSRAPQPHQEFSVRSAFRSTSKQFQKWDAEEM